MLMSSGKALSLSHQRKIIIIILETKLASVHSSSLKCDKCIFLKKREDIVTHVPMNVISLN